LSIGHLETEDVWCLDEKILTLSVTKHTYERLGLTGKPLSSVGAKDRYAISLDLGDTSTKAYKRAKEACENWDRWRLEEEGLRFWGVLVTGTNTWSGGEEGSFAKFESAPSQLRTVRPQVTTLTNIHVPNPSTLFRTGSGAGSEDAEKEEQNENTSDFLEWVGMVTVDSQRLQVNDRVDPYLALYSPPADSAIGDVTHVRWTGLMHTTFVQVILDKML